MVKPKGGRGHIAPYQTTHLRVPVPIKAELEKIIEDYREAVLEGNEFVKEQLLTLEQAKLKAKEVLKSKKGAKKSIAILLTSLYGTKVIETDLDN